MSQTRVKLKISGGIGQVFKYSLHFHSSVPKEMTHWSILEFLQDILKKQVQWLFLRVPVSQLGITIVTLLHKRCQFRKNRFSQSDRAIRTTSFLHLVEVVSSHRDEVVTQCRTHWRQQILTVQVSTYLTNTTVHIDSHSNNKTRLSLSINVRLRIFNTTETAWLQFAL